MLFGFHAQEASPGYPPYVMFMIALAATALGGRNILDIYSDPALPLVLGSRWPLVQGAVWLLAAALAGCAWYSAWRIIHGWRWRDVQAALGILWAAGIGVPALEALARGLLSPASVSETMAGLFAAYKLTLLACACASLMFLRPAVREQYPRDAEEGGAPAQEN